MIKLEILRNILEKNSPELKICLSPLEANDCGYYGPMCAMFNYAFLESKQVNITHNFPFKKHDIIVLVSKHSENLRIKYLFHEYAHYLGLSHKLNHETISHFETKSKDINLIGCEEYIAESVAFRLMDYFNLNTPETVEQSSRYLFRFRSYTIYSNYVNEFIDERYAFIVNLLNVFSNELKAS